MAPRWPLPCVLRLSVPRLAQWHGARVPLPHSLQVPLAPLAPLATLSEGYSASGVIGRCSRGTTGDSPLVAGEPVLGSSSEKPPERIGTAVPAREASGEPPEPRDMSSSVMRRCFRSRSKVAGRPIDILKSGDGVCGDGVCLASLACLALALFAARCSGDSGSGGSGAGR